jgi:predicted ATPase
MLPRHLIGFPAALPPLIGREREIAELRDLLLQPGQRLVTLTGPGGVGKTRLAIAVASEVAPAFKDGVVFVPLAAVGDPSLVVPTIARALEIQEAPGRPLMKALADALRDRRMLVVLDNLEHLLAGARDLVTLLNRCPRLALLVTSRSPLRLSIEQRMATPPLALPSPGDTPDIAALADLGAIALFVARARAVHHGFGLDTGNAAAASDICRRLDGLPLAIELAAAWVRVLPPAALLERLEQRLPLLHGGAADQPGRLRTMRDAIAWSYDLLSDDEARLPSPGRFRGRLYSRSGGVGVGSRDSGDGERTRRHTPVAGRPTPDTRHPTPSICSPSWLTRALYSWRRSPAGSCASPCWKRSASSPWKRWR